VLREIDTALASDPRAAPTPEPEPAAAPVTSAPAEPATLAPPPVAPPGVPLTLLGASPLTTPERSLIDRSDPGAQPPRPIYERGWFWAGGVTAVAVGVAAVILLRPDRYARTGSLGTIGTGP
jgi:hypothetical protein